MKNLITVVCLFALTLVSCNKDEDDGGYTSSSSLTGRWNVISADTRVYDDGRLTHSQTDEFGGEGDYWEMRSNGTITAYIDGDITRTGKWRTENNGDKLILTDDAGVQTSYDILLQTAGGSLRLFQELPAGNQIVRITTEFEKEK